MHPIHAQMAPASQPTLTALPTELLDSLMNKMQPADLCALSLVGSRLLYDLATAPKLWRALYHTRYGPITRRQEHAAVRVGSYRALYAVATAEAKQQSSSPWRKACSAEINACIELMVTKCDSCPETACILLLDGSGSVGQGRRGEPCFAGSLLNL